MGEESCLVGSVDCDVDVAEVLENYSGVNGRIDKVCD